MTFDRLRRIGWYLLLYIKNIRCGKNISLYQPVYFDNGNDGHIEIGDNLSLSHNVTLDASDLGEIHIGDNVFIGPNTVVRASNHDTANHAQHIPGRIFIDSNVWIGANCVILPDVRIGKGAVIGAGSIVTKDIPAYTVAVGNPCCAIRDIENP